MSWIKFVKVTNIKFYVVYFFLCFIFAIMALEVGLRFVTFSSGPGTGSAHQRWVTKYWTPINTDGFRDFNVSINKKQKSILFLGDSFTAGHGAKFQETYYFFARERLSSQFNLVNLGQNGTTTQHQEANLKLFLSKYDVQPQYVVHQYFGNDIRDYIKRIEVERSSLRKDLADVSELFSFVDTYFFSTEFISKYHSQLIATYEDKEIFEKHTSDLKNTHKLVYEKNGNVIFIVFPFLNNDEQIKVSGGAYIEKVKESFLHSCIKGDIFIDVSPLASTLSTNARVVNFMDGHPSPTLHRMIGELLVKVIRGDGSEVVSKDIIRCRQ